VRKNRESRLENKEKKERKRRGGGWKYGPAKDIISP
jgi:hypothetical protein